MSSTSPFGEHLRRERELRGVSLEEISSATRISTRFLEAIENGHWDQLPGGAFNRGFIRSASRYLGLNEESMVAEYSLEVRNGSPQLVPHGSAAIPRAWKGIVTAVLATAFLMAGGWLGGSRIIAHWHSAASRQAAPAAQAGGTPALRSPAQSLELRIRASRQADLRVKADGTSAFDGRITGNEEKQFRARATIEVSTSDAGALRLELNGHAVPTIGPAGQPGRITLTAKGVEPSAGGNH
ncbi:MAG TPA: RodZ domain-containing protein [Candidatus Cybelea sp.]|nr:RodZ domain-containing protein [Candidatus Cybelea sp.]